MTAEIAYRATLRRLFDKVNKIFRSKLKENLPRILRERDQELGINQDSFGDSLDNLILTIKGLAQAEVNETLARLPRLIGRVTSFGRLQNNLTSRAALGIDLFQGNRELQALTESWTKDNTTLIQSIPDKFLGDVQKAINTGLRNGQTARAIGREIVKTTGTNRKRAAFIARDQIGSLNGSIAQAQQKAAGLSLYEWSASQDERTRESHRVLHGKICKWDDPTVYREQGSKRWLRRDTIGAEELHPGAAINCRCTAIAVFESE